MKKLLVLAKFYLLFLVCGVIAFSCCLEPTQVSIIGDGNISFISTADTQLGTTDTISSADFTVFANFELLYVEHSVDLNILPMAYSTSCEEEFQNSFMMNTFAITNSRGFEYNGTTFSAGQNFADIDALTAIFGEGDISIRFTPEFNNNVSFTNGANEFTISVTTTDGLNLESTGSVVFDY